MKKQMLVGGMILVAGIAAYSFQEYRILSFWGLPVNVQDPAIVSKPGRTMRAFASEAELKEHFKKFQEEARRRGVGNGNNFSQSSDSPPSNIHSLSTA